MSPRLRGRQAAADDCPGCFLYERRGVCPMVHPGYDWQQAAVVYRRAQELRQAVIKDAEGAAAGVIELVRRDASAAPSRNQPASASPAALPAWHPPVNFESNPTKENSNVDAARPL
jgi:hypothetical protein